jgi:quercetin dioxygenase-like cupin family protein
LQRGCGGSVGIAMTDEVVIHHGTTMVRRLRLAPGEAMPWHYDPFHRVAVVLSGDVLSIEYRDGGESHRVEIMPGHPARPFGRGGAAK